MSEVYESMPYIERDVQLTHSLTENCTVTGMVGTLL